MDYVEILLAIALAFFVSAQDAPTWQDAFTVSRVCGFGIAAVTAVRQLRKVPASAGNHDA